MMEALLTTLPISLAPPRLGSIAISLHTFPFWGARDVSKWVTTVLYEITAVSIARHRTILLSRSIYPPYHQTDALVDL